MLESPHHAPQGHGRHHTHVCSPLTSPSTLTGSVLELGCRWPDAMTLHASRSHQGHSDSLVPRALWASYPALGKASARLPGTQLPLWVMGAMESTVGTETDKEQTHY